VIEMTCISPVQGGRFGPHTSRPPLTCIHPSLDTFANIQIIFYPRGHP
jgi:hypothetical protein